MNDVFMFLLAPCVMCFLLTGIHCYLGLHVLARGVIFVDLSLAQVAAFGSILAVLLGAHQSSLSTYLGSLSATFIASGIFFLAKKYEKNFSQEAIIGIVYALSSALVILLVEDMPHGPERIKELLVGQILWVSWADVAKTALIYSAVGCVHYVFRKHFIASSFCSEEKHKASRWDFLFYALFGIVITSSVRLAGVLQVFSFLIVPALVASVFCQSLKAKLFFGWVFGLVFSVIGMFISYQYDLPSGACLVFCFTSIPVLLLLLKPIMLKFNSPK